MSSQPKERLLQAPPVPGLAVAFQGTPLESSRWNSRTLKDTPRLQSYKLNEEEDGRSDNEERIAQLSQKLNTRSRVRRCLFNTRRSMILHPIKSLTLAVVAGFLVNMHFLIALGIVYEKLTTDVLWYSKAFIPLICLSGFMLLVCLLSLIVLLLDLLSQGCLAWHRDSFGVIAQRVTMWLCLLMTSANLYSFLWNVEHQILTDMTLLRCFLPMLVFLALFYAKLLCFKVKGAGYALSQSLCLLTFIIVLHLRHDLGYGIPKIVQALPLGLGLLVIAWGQVAPILVGCDARDTLLHGYDRKIKVVITSIQSIATVGYVLALLSSFHLLDQVKHDILEWNRVFEFIIIESMLYSIFMLEASGTYLLDLLFEQFYFDLVIDTSVTRTSKFNNVKLKRLNQLCEDDVKSESGVGTVEMTQKKNIKVSVIGKFNGSRELQKPLLQQQTPPDSEPNTP